MTLVPNTAKAAELQVMIWFLEAGWEVFMPVADLNASDMVIRHPTTRELLAVQVKHKQPGAKNEGQLPNPWAGSEPPFDFLVFFQPAKWRGVILPKEKMKKEGKLFLFFKPDADGYHTGDVRPLFKEFGFELSSITHEARSSAFVRRFAEVCEYRARARAQ